MSLIERAIKKKRSEAEKQKSSGSATPSDQSASGTEKKQEPALIAKAQEKQAAAARISGTDTRPEDPALPPAPELSSSELDTDKKVVKINFSELQKEGYITLGQVRSRTTEEFRVIKRPILSHAMEEGNTSGHVIMVTSAVPGEGKTYTAINLAMSIARERDWYVLLVDADLSRPTITRRLGIEDRSGEKFQGLSELLEDSEMQVTDVILRTDIPNVSIIPAGKPSPMGTELIGSLRAKEIFEEISSRYPNRIIIFDTSPTLASSEGGMLVRSVGQVVFVVEAERTKEDIILDGLSLFDADVKVGLVLNKMRTRLMTSKLAGGYYGGYYGDYFDYNEKEQEKREDD